MKKIEVGNFKREGEEIGFRLEATHPRSLGSFSP
jgi:hypothetical protein